MIGIVFSRNRAVQLDGTLRSFLLNCQDPEEAQLNVIYKATDSLYEQQYQQLMHDYSEFNFIHFVKQMDFRQDLLGLLLEYTMGRPIGILNKSFLRLGAYFGPINKHVFAINEPGYVLFLVDDNIFVRKFTLRDVRDALDVHRDAIGFSLRLGTNINYCYPLNRAQSIPAYSQLENHMLKFNWTASDCDFGYPLEVSSSVYRLDELFPLLCSLPFENPNQLEEKMAALAIRLRGIKPYLLCYDVSVAFCNPINIVQTVGENRAGSSAEYSSESLAKSFDQGSRIRVEEYKNFIPNACHQEVDLVFERRKLS